MTDALSNTPPSAWRALEAHRDDVQATHLRELFAEDPGRFPRYTVRACGLLFDYSKHRITDETVARLLDLARESQLPAAIESMFRGERVNRSENRPALHVALRHRGPAPFPGAGFDVMPLVSRVLGRISALCDALESGSWRGYSGRPIKNIVNIGIGGSHLGPAMVTGALDAYRREGVRAFFVSNLDGADLSRVLCSTDPAETLFVVASKTFGTQETLTNAHTARQWLVEAAGDSAAVARHFVAVSARVDRTSEFGIDPDNVFELWDWVGGRYSLWSAIGLPIAATLGMRNFVALLDGAYQMDQHFRATPLEVNIPVLMGLLGIWCRNFLGAPTHAILPYDYALRELPAHLQQVEMESTGKRVRQDGGATEFLACPVLWGALGNDGQHAFYQKLHQGGELIPSDFIIAANSHHPRSGHQEALVANALAQTQALMWGRTAAEAAAQLEEAGLSSAEAAQAAPHRVLPGNQPTSAIVYERLTPQVLGSLIAMYEHKVLVQATCWGVNPFDQWGVELGKELASKLLGEITGESEPSPTDSSTRGLVEHLRALRSDSGESSASD